MSRADIEITEDDILYAYQVLDAFKQALDHVAVNPDKMEQLQLEFIKKMPNLFEALMILMPLEHRGIIFEMFQSTGRLSRSWMKKWAKERKR